MANGGDIQFEFIKEQDFKALEPSHREWLLYKGVRSLSFTCHQRPSLCEKKFVRVRHVVFAAGVVVAFLMGAGVIQTQLILPAMIKAAVASIIPVP